MQNHTKQAPKNSDATAEKVYTIVSVTSVTTVTGSPIIARGSGLASTGSVDTDPLVRAIPETPGGDANG